MQSTLVNAGYCAEALSTALQTRLLTIHRSAARAQCTGDVWAEDKVCEEAT